MSKRRLPANQGAELLTPLRQRVQGRIVRLRIMRFDMQGRGIVIGGTTTPRIVTALPVVAASPTAIGIPMGAALRIPLGFRLWFILKRLVMLKQGCRFGQRHSGPHTMTLSGGTAISNDRTASRRTDRAGLHTR